MSTSEKLGTGTARGIHFLESWLGCGHRAYLDQQARAKGEQTSTHSEATAIGSLVHQYLQAYYMPGSAEPIEVANIPHFGFETQTKIAQKAEDTFRAYRAMYGADEFGTIRDVEWGFSCQSPMGVAIEGEITGQIDMVVSFDSDQAEAFSLQRGCMVTAGNYIVDHKTCGYMYKQFDDLYAGSFQMWLYSAAWQDLHPYEELNGYIINAMTVSMRPTFRTGVYPVPGPQQLKNLQRHLQLCAVRVGYDAKCATASNCFFPTPCHWYETGACTR